MANELTNALKQLHKILSDNLPGLRQAPELPTDAANAFPYMVIYPASGVWEPSGGSEIKASHTIVVQIHIARQQGDLSRAMEQALPYGDLVKDIIYAGGGSQNYNLNSTVHDVADPSIRYTFGQLDWGGIKTLGWSFEIPMHIQSRWDSTEGTYVKG